MRGCTTRIPASAAGCAAPSHSWHTTDRKSLPLGARSSITWSPVCPYQPTADALTSTSGGVFSRDSAAASVSVPSTRLSRISRR